ncbi:IclR family transcriptional regulator [Acinetobacter sp. ANC 4173]|uniref:IclR family transcriptional regulator n=1 Tax=Acinetobacter sp. ANC 4173 TaxID=2529837 RepID=UPI0013F14ABE|nr:IclR family transcriptional regulator C-terminal domain-containing protein [Acinetobacter sp. ANC 4173]
MENKRGIQSVEVASEILKVICSSPKPLSLSEIADILQIVPGSVHIYLVSLMRTGLLKRDETTLEYEPGALGLRLGISHFNKNQLIINGKIRLSAFAEKYELNAFISMWSNEGPSVIFYKEFAGFLNISFKLGLTLSLLETTVGQLYCAYKSPEEVLNIIEKKPQKKYKSSHYSTADFQNMLKDIRKNKHLMLDNTPTNGITAIAVPVLDKSNSISLALTVFTETEKLKTISTPINQLIEELIYISENLYE